jgi:hypothetical protein
MAEIEILKPTDVRSFSSGVYEHYKGGTYTALALVPHHEHRFGLAMVEYVSHTYGNIAYREWRQSDLWGRTVDAWTDEVEWPEGSGVKVPRFRFVRALG